jgi:hypothetical protein
MQLDPIGTLFANSWKRFEERFAVTVGLFAAPTVLLTLSRLLLAQRTSEGILMGVLIEILGVIVSIIASLGIIAAYGKNTNFTESFEIGTKFFWASIWIGILVSLAFFGGLIMLIIPGIILMVQLAFASYALVLDDKHGIAALAQSRAYIIGHWWATFGRTLLLVLIFIVFGLVILAPIVLLTGGVVGSIIYGVFMLFITPFAVAYQYEIFHNLRRLKPHVAELAAKDDSSFVKVSMIVGIVGAVLVPICIVAAIVLESRVMEHHGYPNSGILLPPNSGPGVSGFNPGGPMLPVQSTTSSGSLQ